MVKVVNVMIIQLERMCNFKVVDFFFLSLRGCSESNMNLVKLLKRKLCV